MSQGLHSNIYVPVYLRSSQVSEASVRDSREGTSLACAACVPRAQKIGPKKCLLEVAYFVEFNVEANSWIVILLLPPSRYTRHWSSQGPLMFRWTFYVNFAKGFFKYFFVSMYSLLIKTPWPANQIVICAIASYSISYGNDLVNESYGMRADSNFKNKL